MHIIYGIARIQVFLPLLVEHFSESELRQLTKTVNQLHHLEPQQGEGVYRYNLLVHLCSLLEVRMTIEMQIHMNMCMYQSLQPFTYLFRTVALTICVFFVLFPYLVLL